MIREKSEADRQVSQHGAISGAAQACEDMPLLPYLIVKASRNKFFIARNWSGVNGTRLDFGIGL
jgi:hypothetical protein